MKYVRILRPWAMGLVLICLLCPCYAVEDGYTVFYGNRDTPYIALTVDDCYSSENVQKILDLCERYNVPVTFFVVGSALKLEDKELWQRALKLGCEIGNHTWAHKDVSTMTREGIGKTLQKTQDKLNETLGFQYTMQLMRPPYGRLSKDPKKKSDIWVVEAIEEAGYTHAVRWDVDETNAAKALKDVQNGSILLYHANARDVKCLTTLIPALLEKGYTCVTASELLGLENPEAEE